MIVTNQEIIEVYSIENKKKDIHKLKNCAEYYKRNLIGKRFLILYNDGEFLEILFSSEHFRHLTGISSNLNAKKFYQKCIGLKGTRKIFISPNEIYTTKQHPRALALKKMEVFNNILFLFQNQSYLSKTVNTNSVTYSFGISNITLTLLCERHPPNSEIIPVSLRSKSYLKKSMLFYPVEYVLVKLNPYMKFSEITYPNNIDIQYFNRNRKKLEAIIDYSVLTENQGLVEV